MRTRIKQLAALAFAIGGVAAATPTAVDATGFIPDTLEYGFFYGTFDQSPNIALFAGGTIEEFCASPPDSGPSDAPLRVFLRDDGTVDLKTNAKGQKIYLYETTYNDIPIWLDEVCPAIGGGAPAPMWFAEGEADLKVRITDLANGTVEVFNSVNGKATGNDGTEYKVKASADLVVVDDVPQGDPREFVDFELTEIRRR